MDSGASRELCSAVADGIARGELSEGEGAREKGLRKAALVIILASSFATLAALAADRTLAPGLPGHLQIFIAVSDSPDYIEEWPRISTGRKVVIPQIKEIELGETAYVSFIVTGYTLDDKQTPDVTVDVSILQRDGVVFFEKESYAAVKNGPAAPRGLIMADPTLEMELKADDLLGTYGIMVVAHDRISGKKTQAGYALLATEPPPAERDGKEKNEKPPP
jgi:hypothetical protein